MDAPSEPQHVLLKRVAELERQMIYVRSECDMDTHKHWKLKSSLDEATEELEQVTKKVETRRVALIQTKDTMEASLKRYKATCDDFREACDAWDSVPKLKHVLPDGTSPFDELYMQLVIAFIWEPGEGSRSAVHMQRSCKALRLEMRKYVASHPCVHVFVDSLQEKWHIQRSFNVTHCTLTCRTDAYYHELDIHKSMDTHSHVSLAPTKVDNQSAIILHRAGNDAVIVGGKWTFNETGDVVDWSIIPTTHIAESFEVDESRYGLSYRANCLAVREVLSERLQAIGWGKACGRGCVIKMLDRIPIKTD